MEKTNISIDKRMQHLKPSPKTREELNELKDCQEKFRLCQEKMSTKLDEIHKVFTGVKFTQKVVIWFFTTAGVIAGGMVAIKMLFKKIV